MSAMSVIPWGRRLCYLLALLRLGWSEATSEATYTYTTHVTGRRCANWDGTRQWVSGVQSAGACMDTCVGHVGADCDFFSFDGSDCLYSTVSCTIEVWTSAWTVYSVVLVDAGTTEAPSADNASTTEAGATTTAIPDCVEQIERHPAVVWTNPFGSCDTTEGNGAECYLHSSVTTVDFVFDRGEAGYISSVSFQAWFYTSFSWEVQHRQQIGDSWATVVSGAIGGCCNKEVSADVQQNTRFIRIRISNVAGVHSNQWGFRRRTVVLGCPPPDPCNATDGSSTSDFYPCPCGGATCTNGQLCDLAASTCFAGWWHSVTGGCSVDRETQCVRSPNFPSNYGNSQQCTVSVDTLSSGPLEAVSFNVQNGWDWLYVNGVSYTGTSGPSAVTPTASITWTSSSGGTASGWELCPVPSCDSTDGSGLSSAYPCRCGSGACQANEVCAADSSSCTPGPCDVTDGSGQSSFHPCTCGSATCTASHEQCNASASSCEVPPAFWMVAGIEESCDDACLAVGRACHEDANWPDSLAEFQAIQASHVFGCANTYTGSWGLNPTIYNGGTCYWNGYGSNRCSSAGYNGYRRICPCYTPEPCSVADGSSLSSAYPCSCGNSTCSNDHALCTEATSTCAPRPCSVRDGSSLSDYYPCACGASVCSSLDKTCTGSSSNCSADYSCLDGYVAPRPEMFCDGDGVVVQGDEIAAWTQSARGFRGTTIRATIRRDEPCDYHFLMLSPSPNHTFGWGGRPESFTFIHSWYYKWSYEEYDGYYEYCLYRLYYDDADMDIEMEITISRDGVVTWSDNAGCRAQKFTNISRNAAIFDSDLYLYFGADNSCERWDWLGQTWSIGAEWTSLPRVEAHPLCSVTDGSSLSAAYPCSCGNATCSNDRGLCTEATSTCAPEPCSARDGSSLSAFYPCSCGDTTCWNLHGDGLCAEAANTCAPAPCSIVDGSNASSSYPCTCGSATCTASYERCDAASSACVVAPAFWTLATRSESCHDTCNATGRLCDDDAAWPASREEFEAIYESALLWRNCTISKGRWDRNPSWYDDGRAGKCYWNHDGSLADRCSRAPSGSDSRRICPCYTPPPSTTATSTTTETHTGIRAQVVSGSATFQAADAASLVQDEAAWTAFRNTYAELCGAPASQVEVALSTGGRRLPTARGLAAESLVVEYQITVVSTAELPDAANEVSAALGSVNVSHLASQAEKALQQQGVDGTSQQLAVTSMEAPVTTQITLTVTTGTATTTMSATETTTDANFSTPGAASTSRGPASSTVPDSQTVEPNPTAGPTSETTAAAGINVGRGAEEIAGAVVPRAARLTLTLAASALVCCH